MSSAGRVSGEVPVSASCCSCANVGKVILAVMTIAILAIGIAGLTGWDFGGLGQLDWRVAILMTVAGSMPVALYIISREPAASTPEYNESQAKTEFFAAFKRGDVAAIANSILTNPSGVSDWVDENKNNALHLAASTHVVRKPNGQLDYGATAQIPEILNRTNVLLHGLNAQEQTPLHVAVINRNYVAVLYLLNTNRVNVNAIDGAGHTPLHYAEEAFKTDNQGEYLVSSRGGSVDSRVKIKEKLLAMGAVLHPTL